MLKVMKRPIVIQKNSIAHIKKYSIKKWCICIKNKKPKRLENSQLLRKTLHVNQIFELIIEQCVANYYGDNTIAK